MSDVDTEESDQKRKEYLKKLAERETYERKQKVKILKRINKQKDKDTEMDNDKRKNEKDFYGSLVKKRKTSLGELKTEPIKVKTPSKPKISFDVEQ